MAGSSVLIVVGLLVIAVIITGRGQCFGGFAACMGGASGAAPAPAVPLPSLPQLPAAMPAGPTVPALPSTMGALA